RYCLVEAVADGAAHFVQPVVVGRYRAGCRRTIADFGNIDAAVANVGDHRAEVIANASHCCSSKARIGARRSIVAGGRRDFDPVEGRTSTGANIAKGTTGSTIAVFAPKREVIVDVGKSNG